MGERAYRENFVTPTGSLLSPALARPQAPPPSSEQSLARHYPWPAIIVCGASGTSTSASVGILQHEELAVGVSAACRGSNDVISPCGSSEITVRGQSVDPLGEDADNELLWEGWAAFWAYR